MRQTTHALLVTDVVDSTKLTETLGDAGVAEVWAAHDRLARDLLATHEGREIDKADGFLLLFHTASDALDYALGYHRALKDLGLEARAGLHVGEVLLRENSAADVARGAKPLELEGLAKSTAARVMSAARGGQTLATSAAVDALDIPHATREPDGHLQGDGPIAVSHGRWRLKGVLRPLELLEVGILGEAPLVPPPDAPKAWRVHWKNEAWVPVKQIKHSLPRERDAFVGREEDLHALAELLDQGAALVSVLGIGGAGKTRLVTHFGWAWLGDWPGGVWFCDLSEARSVDGIASAVGRALDVQLGKDPLEQLGHAIAGRGRCLVILDNFEQVARHVHETLGPWLDRAADAQFVVTTRELLGLRGETALALAPLDPAEGVALFVARARQAKRDFAADDLTSIESLVVLLDGLPLAIELAAARVRMMPPKTLLARMSQRFKLLTSSGGRRDRQATLRGALDWSWDLLSEDEQAALAQLSVFEGGFTLEAAAAVLELEELWPEDAVQALLDKSLVRAVSDERFDLLMSVREYAAARLEMSGGAVEAQTRHGRHFAGLGTHEALTALTVHGGVARRRLLSADLDNLVVAARRAAGREDGPVATAALEAAWAALSMRGPFALGVDVATTALAITRLEPLERAAVARVLGDALCRLGRGAEARPHYAQALGVARARGDHRLEGSVLSSLGGLESDRGRMDNAHAHYSRSLEVARAGGDRRLEGAVLCNLGILHWTHGRMDEARAHYEQALAIDRASGNRGSVAIVLSNLGNLCADQGQMDAARPHYEKALEVAREVGDLRFEGVVLGNLGLLHAEQGRSEEARAHYEQALEIHRGVGNRRTEGVVLGYLGNLLEAEGRGDEARVRYEQALALHREVGNRRFEGALLSNLGGLHVDHGRMPEARAAFDASEVLLRAVEDPVELAKLFCSRVLLEHAEGHAQPARAALEEAEALADKVGAGDDSELGAELTKARAALEASAEAGY